MRSAAAPLVVIMVILMLLMATGYWGAGGPVLPNAQRKTDEPKAVAEAPAAKPAPGPTQEAAKQQQAAPTTTVPAAVNPAKPNFSIADARKAIDRAAGAKETMLVTAYYADGSKNGESLQPVQVRVPQTTGVLRAVAEQVLAAPTDLKLYSNIPAGTKIRSVDFDAKTGIATLELSPEIESVQGSGAANNVMASLVYSLTEVKDVKAVQVKVGDRPALLHGIDWAGPLTRADMDARAYFKLEPLIKFTATP